MTVQRAEAINYEAAGSQNESTRYQKEYEEMEVAIGPDPCISNPKDLQKEIFGDSQYSLNLPEKAMQGMVGINEAVSDDEMQVNLPIDIESQSDSSDKMMLGEEYLKQLAEGREAR